MDYNFKFFLVECSNGQVLMHKQKKMMVNITSIYLYDNIFDRRNGISIIAGKTGSESIPILKNALKKLDEEFAEVEAMPILISLRVRLIDDYESNKKSLLSLLDLALKQPEGKWVIG